jgi:site-specific recombinase XerD
VQAGAEHLEKRYAKMVAAGAEAGTAHQVHRTAKTAFGVAVDRGHLTKNPAKLAKSPRVDEDEIIFLTAAEAKRVLAAARHRRNGARLVSALALGLRRGEALGLKLKVPPPAIMEVMGWGDASVAKRYVHVPTKVVAGIADQVAGFLWDDTPAAPKPTPPDAASLIDQLQRLLDAAKVSGDSPEGEEPPGLRAVI